MSKKLVNGVLVDMTADEISAKNAETTAWNNPKFNTGSEVFKIFYPKKKTRKKTENVKSRNEYRGIGF